MAVKAATKTALRTWPEGLASEKIDMKSLIAALIGLKSIASNHWSTLSLAIFHMLPRLLAWALSASAPLSVTASEITRLNAVASLVEAEIAFAAAENASGP